ncbi:hypothetical protein [Mesorhizobium sp.]|uniref:hypothetical protein n=1 Tax=Mesorhizobium sp. TaxID=1871066 RepID=UPI0025910381|nr:hypothetical protein [Mesorhizobium sp.]
MSSDCHAQSPGLPVENAGDQVIAGDQHHAPPFSIASWIKKLLQSGVDLLTIQAWLGHAQVATTHRYAAADVEMMRNGLEKAGVAGDHGVRFRPNDAVLQLLNSI